MYSPEIDARERDLAPLSRIALLRILQLALGQRQIAVVEGFHALVVGPHPGLLRDRGRRQQEQDDEGQPGQSHEREGLIISNVVTGVFCTR